jgi:hypothetical protein
MASTIPWDTTARLATPEGAAETRQLLPVPERTRSALRIRKNRRDLGADEWAAYIAVIEAIAADDAFFFKPDVP